MEGGSDHFAQQVLVRFQHETSVLYLPRKQHDQIEENTSETLLSLWSARTGWPLQSLKIQDWQLPFVTIAVQSSIRGGKGGFGTLLKGQSRQAGAKLTTDFGACRDLQGRRLRHVNDEIKLRKWREMQRREQAGEKVPDDELWKTPSGIYNWHLMTPTWADISKKATYGIKRQFQKLNQIAQKEALKKKEQEAAYQNSMTHYLEQATSATDSIQKSIPDAIQQGLAAAAATNKKRKRSSRAIETSQQVENAEPNSLVTLSGELVMESTSVADTGARSASGFQLQSQSDFGTAVLVLDRATSERKVSIVYYEITLVTGGLAQIGWASLVGETPFEPNNDLGDGVGDDFASYAIDGSRGLKFHAGDEQTYPLQWKEGDRLGCWVDARLGTVEYSLNGKNLGRAFEMPKDRILTLVPAFSCNQGQILQFHTTKSDCNFFPQKDAMAVADLVADEDSSKTETKPTPTTESKPNPVTVGQSDRKASTFNPPSVCEPENRVLLKPEALDLDTFNSPGELEALGMNRLKSALMAIQAKCGGTISERAARLYSLKGLARKEYPQKVRAKGFLEYW